MNLKEFLDSVESAYKKHGDIPVRARNQRRGTFSRDGVSVRMGDNVATKGVLLIEGHWNDKPFET